MASTGAQSQNIEYDLHIHSNISDGTFSPYQIIDKAKKLGLKGISITDHDDISLDHISNYAKEKGLNYIYGIEFSTDISNLHILGYDLDLNNPLLNEFLQSQKAEREIALRKMCENTKKHGVPVEFSELKNIKTKSLGRPHLAQIMIEKGYVSNFYEAFQKYLRTDKPIFVDYKKYSYKYIMEIIVQCKGLAVFAHPGMLKNNIFQSIIYDAIKLGLNGMEVYYPRHSKEQIKYLIKIAKEYNLLITGGSDFHGENKPDIHIGDAGISQDQYNELIKHLS